MTMPALSGRQDTPQIPPGRPHKKSHPPENSAPGRSRPAPAAARRPDSRRPDASRRSSAGSVSNDGIPGCGASPFASFSYSNEAAGSPCSPQISAARTQNWAGCSRPSARASAACCKPRRCPGVSVRPGARNDAAASARVGRTTPPASSINCVMRCATVIPPKLGSPWSAACLAVPCQSPGSPDSSQATGRRRAPGRSPRSRAATCRREQPR